MISELIDKQDSFEIIRDQIAAILVTEINSQMALATAAGKNPDDYKLRVFKERSNPFEQFLNDQSDQSPLVNIWYESSTFDARSSNIIERQKATATFNIDCYGYGQSAENGAGHTPGDQQAALNVQRALRLVRNILMASNYTYLGLQRFVFQRWPESVTVFQPQQEGRQMQQIVGARLALRVQFSEFAPQYTPENLELISTLITESSTGEQLIAADYLSTQGE